MTSSSLGLIGPVLALIVWTLVMLFWGVGKSVVAARRLGLKGVPKTGTRVRDLETHIPAEAAWGRQNYEHLVEQPTLYYAVTLSLVAMNHQSALGLILAWAYVALRIAHSLYQVTINVGQVRGRIFAMSTLCLILLTGVAVADFLRLA